jgi:glucokinase
MILAGDIGGTNTRIAWLAAHDGRLVLSDEKVYASREHQTLEDIVALFLQARPGEAETACFGIAGPVVDGRVTATNLPWVVDAARLSQKTLIPAVWFINDLQAHACGIADLNSGDLIPLNPGKPVPGNAALIAAGTGLGEAGMFFDGSEHQAFAGEGGHADFGPNNDVERALASFLEKKFGHVSSERVVSGPGIKNIYDFLCAAKLEEEPEWLREELAGVADPVVLISEYALKARTPICERALDIFVSAYGAEAGNVALRLMAVGGVYVSGGIAGKIMPLMKKPLFMNAFVEKGRMKPLLQNVPVHVIINDQVGLLGAGRYAVRNSQKNLKPVYS